MTDAVIATVPLQAKTNYHCFFCHGQLNDEIFVTVDTSRFALIE